MGAMEDLAGRLSAVGEEREEARARAQAASERLLVLAMEALNAGMTKSDIARHARISRQGLDLMLDRARARRVWTTRP